MTLAPTYLNPFSRFHTCAITNLDLNRSCFGWHPYGKLGLIKTELVTVV